MVMKYLFFLPILFIQNIHAVVKGSVALPSVEDYYTFPQYPGLFANEIKAFAWMKNGFGLETNSTECIFSSVFPVSGTVDLNGGQLILMEDLIFRNTTTLSSLGAIIGNGRAIHLCSSINTFPSDANIFESVTIFCDSDLDIVSTVTFTGNSSICGVGNVIKLKEGGGVFVASGSRLQLRDVEMQGVAGENIQCVDDTSSLVLDSSRLIQSESTYWKKGSILFKNSVTMMGSSTFSYSSAQTSTIAIDSQFIVGDGMYICMGRDVETQNDPLYFEDSSSKLRLDNCSFIASDQGVLLTRGTLVLDRLVNIDAMGTTTSTGVILGDGSPENDITIWVSPGAALSHNSGYWVYNNYASDRLIASSQSSRMIRELGSKIYMPQNFTIKDITVQLKSNYVAPIEVESGRQLSYDSACVRLPDIKFDISAQQINAYTYALSGNQSLFLTKGTLPLYLVVSGTSNAIRGNGGFAGAITLSNSSAELTAGLNGYIGSALVLNDGTFNLDYDLLFHGDGNVVGPGTIDLKKNHLAFGSGFQATTPIYWKSDGGVIDLSGKVTLSSTWTIEGNCTFKGDTSKLIFAEGGEIVIEKNSQLVFHNMRILGLAEKNLRCVDNSGVITSLESRAEMTGDYCFEKGSMEFYLQNVLSGAYTFSYDSEMTSTIQSDASLEVINGVTFAVGRNNGNEPFAFVDKTSTLKLEDCKLFVNDTGLQMLRGTVISSRDVQVDVQSTNTATGLIFGDGNPDNDMKLIMLPGVTVRFLSGVVTYNITDPLGIESKINVSHMIRKAGSFFYLYQNLFLSNLTVDVDALAHLTIEPGVSLTYSNCRILNGRDEFSFTGSYYNFYTMLMSGNDNILNMINGTFPLFLLVSGLGNRIDGTGNIGGLLSFADRNAELISNFSGTVFMSPILNGGTIRLQKDINLANEVVIKGDGYIDLGTSNIYVGLSNTVWDTDIHWKSINGAINFYGKVDLKGTWTLEGDVEIKGNGQMLRLLSGGALCVAPHSRLCLSGLIIEDIGGNDIYCMDDNSVLVFDNTAWGQLCSADYTFTKGAMCFKNDVTMYGNANFVYESNQTSTICADSRLKFDTGFTFSYDADTPYRFALEDETATLLMNNSTLYITTTGLSLTKGSLDIKGDSAVLVESYETENDIGKIIETIDEGLQIGNGLDGEDCTLTIYAGSSLTVLKGSVVYNNRFPESFKAKNKLSHIFLEDQARLVLYQDLDLGLGSLLLRPSSSIRKNTGKNITGSIVVK